MVRVFGLMSVLWVVAAPALGEPSAHAPGFADRRLWPEQNPRPEYMDQQWPAAALYVWADPGRSGSFDEPGNWRVDGKPAASAPDENVDVWLPDADNAYKVNAGRQQSVRHLTVGRNAGIQGAHRGELSIWGNGWIKDGGYAYYIAFRGPGHSFFRIDNAELPAPDNKVRFGHTGRGGGFDARTQLSHKLQICKYGDGSVEFIGDMGVSDEIMVQFGRLIVNGDLRWSGATNKGALEIYDGAVVELRSGARIGAMTNTNGKSVYNLDIYRNGTLQAGSPHRPLNADAKVLLGVGPDSPPGKVGLFAAAGSMIRVYSSDPTRHRLVFAAANAEDDFHDGNGRPLGGDGATVLQLAGDVQFDGVAFDHMHAGGIKLLDPDLPRTWKHVSYGPNNAAQGEKLFDKLTENANVYYHDRGDARSEWGLTKKAVASMEAYMQQNDSYRLGSSPPAADAAQDTKLDRPQAVAYRQPIDVELTCALDGAKIYYTLDGSEPTDKATLYARPIRLTETTRVRVRAYAPGREPSAVYSVSYVVEAAKP